MHCAVMATMLNVAYCAPLKGMQQVHVLPNQSEENDVHAFCGSETCKESEEGKEGWRECCGGGRGSAIKCVAASCVGCSD
jgi:hypothetical protein